MKEIKKILNEFVKECSEKLKLYSIVQFGSSTYSKDFDDIDLLFVFNQKVFSPNELLKLRKIILEFEKCNLDVLFDFGGVETRKRKAKFEITVVLACLKDLELEHNPNNLFFLKTLLLDKNKKILLGRDPFEELQFKLTDQHLFEMLSLDIIYLMRKSLDDDNYLFNHIYFIFKTYLRAMLIKKGQFPKTELLNKFKETFRKEIKLPKNSRKIIKKEIVESDFKDILRFAENCLNYLTNPKS